MVKEFLSLTNFSCISTTTEPMEEFLSTVPTTMVASEGCFRRRRESSFVLVVRLLLCRRECGQDNEVLLVGSLTDQDDG